MARKQIDPTFGENVRRIRLSLGLKQSAMCDMSGLYGSHLNMIENGKREPGLAAIKKILSVLKVPFEELISPHKSL